MICDNCGVKANFKELGYDELDNLILECQDCGAVCYEDGTLIEGEIRRINRILNKICILFEHN